jgi:hypothetical protein
MADFSVEYRAYNLVKQDGGFSCCLYSTQPRETRWRIFLLNIEHQPRETRWRTSPGEDAVSWLCLEVEDAAHRPVVLAQRLVQVNSGHLTLKHMYAYRNFSPHYLNLCSFKEVLTARSF